MGRLFQLGVLALGLAGCNIWPVQLQRASAHYDVFHYEAALANLEDLEHHLPALTHGERVRYEFLRGMSYYHIGRKADARHWLAIAREDGKSASSVLSAADQGLIERVLEETDPLGAPPTTAH